jgi:hypothetical protein
MALYHVTVRVHTGWPVSASGLYELRDAGAHLPGPLRVRRTLVHVEGYLDVVVRTRRLPAMAAIHQIRLLLPMLGLRRDQVGRIDVRRVHPLRSHRTLIASWLPPAAHPARPGPGGSRLSLSA